MTQPTYSSSIQEFSTHCLTRLSYSFLSFSYRDAASELAGEDGFGSDSRDWQGTALDSQRGGRQWPNTAVPEWMSTPRQYHKWGSTYFAKYPSKFGHPCKLTKSMCQKGSRCCQPPGSLTVGMEHVSHESNFRRLVGIFLREFAR